MNFERIAMLLLGVLILLPTVYFVAKLATVGFYRGREYIENERKNRDGESKGA